MLDTTVWKGNLGGKAIWPWTFGSQCLPICLYLSSCPYMLIKKHLEKLQNTPQSLFMWFRRLLPLRWWECFEGDVKGWASFCSYPFQRAWSIYTVLHPFLRDKKCEWITVITQPWQACTLDTICVSASKTISILPPLMYEVYRWLFYGCLYRILWCKDVYNKTHLLIKTWDGKSSRTFFVEPWSGLYHLKW